MLPLALFAVPLIATLAVGPARVLAYYEGVIHVGVDPLALLERTGMNLLVLLYASGFVLVPGAILGLVLVIARPRTRGELVFGAMTLLLAVSLLVEAGLFGAFEQAQERYLFYFLPLIVICFGLYAARGWPWRLYHVLLAAGVVTAAAVVPLAGYAASDEKAHSALLYGVFRIEQWLGTPGNGSIAVALAGTCALAVLVACSARIRVAASAGIALAILFSSGLAAAGVVFDQENARSVRKAFLPADPSWVDHAHVGDVSLLRNIAGVRGGAFQQLFWNRSVKELLLMPGAPEIDPFRADRVQVADDGSLLVGKRVLTGALLVDDHAVTTQFSGAVKVASAPGYSLYRPAGQPRLALFFLARYDDGWMGDKGTINLWPRLGSDRLEGTLVIDLESPPPLGATTVQFRLPDGRVVHVRVPARRLDDRPPARLLAGTVGDGCPLEASRLRGRPPCQREGRRPSLRPRPLWLLRSARAGAGAAGSCGPDGVSAPQRERAAAEPAAGLELKLVPQARSVSRSRRSCSLSSISPRSATTGSSPARTCRPRSSATSSSTPSWPRASPRATALPSVASPCSSRRRSRSSSRCRPGSSIRLRPRTRSSRRSTSP